MNYPEASAIAQAIKYQMRTGKFWDELTPAAKETFDQIATAVARTVSGDGAHWDGIIGFAQAARPRTAEPLVDNRFGQQAHATVEIERGIRQMVQEIPTRNSNAT